MEKHFIYLLLFSIFLSACASSPSQNNTAHFSCKANYSFIHFSKKSFYTGKLIWYKNENEEKIVMLGPLNIPLVELKKENEILCFKQGKKELCGENFPQNLEAAQLLFSQDFKEMLKGNKTKNDFLQKEKIQIKFNDENNQSFPSSIQFKKEKEWQFNLIIENMVF